MEAVFQRGHTPRPAACTYLLDLLLQAVHALLPLLALHKDVVNLLLTVLVMCCKLGLETRDFSRVHASSSLVHGQVVIRQLALKVSYL